MTRELLDEQAKCLSGTGVPREWLERIQAENARIIRDALASKPPAAFSRKYLANVALGLSAGYLIIGVTFVLFCHWVGVEL